jgi:hypothetical protein
LKESFLVFNGLLKSLFKKNVPQHISKDIFLLNFNLQKINKLIIDFYFIKLQLNFIILNLYEQHLG